jgi:hypothetical protein
VKAARRLFFITFVTTLMFEAEPFSGDLLATFGQYFHRDLKSWLPIGLPFSVMELLILTAATLWLFRGSRSRRVEHYDRGRLMTPVVAFGAAVTLGVLWGLLRGGDNLTFALFEIRGLGVLIFAYLLAGMFLRDEHDLGVLIWCMLLATAGLATQNIVRYFTVFGASVANDLSYEHDDSVILAFGVILCLALLAFGGTRAQRRVSLLLFPFILFCLALMQRRAAWPVLFVGLVILAIMLFRARPKVFWRVVPVVAVLLAGYLAIFWNNTGTVGQPARAIRSQISPDPRDLSSDQYRMTEHYDIVANIRTSRVLGLGFGQPYVFYVPLPDLSFWPFWRYESHNSVLWLWMDGGIPVFFTFMWLAGSGLAAGGRELNARREAWSLPRLRRRRVASRRERATTSAGPNTGAHAVGRHTRGAAAQNTMGAPHGARNAVMDARAHGAATALLAASVCYIPMQIVFSSVDLGLVNPRDMLLLGVSLGVAGRTFSARASARSAPRVRARVRGAGSGTADVAPADPAQPLVTMKPS